MATKRPGDDTNGHSGNGAAPDAKKTKDVSKKSYTRKITTNSIVKKFSYSMEIPIKKE